MISFYEFSHVLATICKPGTPKTTLIFCDVTEPWTDNDDISPSKKETERSKNSLIYSEASGPFCLNRTAGQSSQEKERELRNLLKVFRGGQDSDSILGALGFMCFSKGLVKTSAWNVPACCWLWP